MKHRPDASGTPNPIKPPDGWVAIYPSKAKRHRFPAKAAWLLGVLGILATTIGYTEDETPGLREARSDHPRQVRTIVPQIQSLAETHLRDFSGALVVLDPRNGHVLALAGSGTASEETLSERDGRRAGAWGVSPLALQKTSVETYRPGSAFALVAVLAGIDSPRFDPEKPFLCPSDAQRDDFPLRCWKRTGHGPLNLRAALAQKCLPCLVQAGVQTGALGIVEHAAQCGFGVKTGMGLDAEAAGELPHFGYERMLRDPSEILYTAFLTEGFGVRATPLQMAVFTAALANGGVLHTPRFLIPAPKGTDTSSKGTDNSEGTANVRRLPVGKAALDAIREGMRGAVMDSDGVARDMRIAGSEIAAFRGMYFGERNRPQPKTGWILLFAPVQAPRYAVVLVAKDVSSDTRMLDLAVTRLMRDIVRYEKAGSPDR